MIQHIFLPEKIGNYVLFPKRIMAIDLQRNGLVATIMVMSGRKTTIEDVIELPLSPGNASDYTERAIAALKELMLKVKGISEIRTVFSSSLVVFKTLRLPFTSPEKIKMVIDFEVEPLLPFPLSTAVVDFIITKVMPEEKSAEVMVAAVQKEHIAEHLALFEAAGVTPDIVTIDVFAIYGFYQLISTHQQKSESVAIIDLALDATRISLIINGQLQAIRVLPQGIYALAKHMGAELNINNGQALESLLRFGLTQEGSPEYQQSMRNHLNDFLQKIQFTLASFNLQESHIPSIHSLLILGEGAKIQGMQDFIAQALAIPCETLNPYALEAHGIHIDKKVKISSTEIASVGAALTIPTLVNFNMLRNAFERTNQQLLIKQVVASILLALILLTTLTTHMILQVRSLRNELNDSRTQALDALKERFKRIDKDETDLDEAIDAARQELKTEQNTWSKFSDQAKSSYLRYLLELTNRIDVQGLGFDIERLVMSDNTLTIKARVKDHDALKKFEHELQQSKLFSYVETQNDPDFEMHITLSRSSSGEQA